MPFRLLIIFALMPVAAAIGREWRSAEGGRVIEGNFVRLANDSVAITLPSGSTIVIKLDALAFADQAYARAAQTTLDESTKLGPRSFEITRVLSKGALCRLSMTMGNGSVLFTGEEFMLLADLATLKQGERRKDQPLFFAGKRIFHPVKGEPSPMRSFALTLDAATTSVLDLTSGLASADLYEPVIETFQARGLGIAIGGDGLVLVESSLLDGATNIDLDMGREHSPGTIVSSNPELGVTVLIGKGQLTPARLAPRKPIVLGQPVLGISYGLAVSGKAIGEPTITKGIISKLSSKDKKTFFEHDAARDSTSLGGVIVSEKGDVVGIMVANPSIKKVGTRKPTSEAVPPPPLLSACLRSDELINYLKTIPKNAAMRVASSATLAESAKSFRESLLIVTVLRETVKEVTPPAPIAKAATPNSPSTGTPEAGTSWSLSKSGTRHNAKCRFYDASKACQSTDGKPCKTCGG